MLQPSQNLKTTFTHAYYTTVAPDKIINEDHGTYLSYDSNLSLANFTNETNVLQNNFPKNNKNKINEAGISSNIVAIILKV